MSFYYTTPNHSVALNAKVASSSMARAIIKKFHAKQQHLIATAAYPAGMDEMKRAWHWMCPGSRTPDKPVVLLVRDPVDRFITAMQQVGLKKKDVNQAINSLVNDTAIVRTDRTPAQIARAAKRSEKAGRRRQRRADKGLPVGPAVRDGRLRDDVHFQHQHGLAAGPTTCFRFPVHIQQAADFIGLTEPLPKRNEAKREKPALTAAQEAAVRAYYAADQALFDAIAQPGYVYTPPA